MANVIEIIVSLKDETSQKLKSVSDSLEKTGKNLRSLGTQAAAAGAAVTASFGLITKIAVDYSSNLDKASKISGVAVDALSKLGYAALQEHASLETLNVSLKYLGQRMVEARAGSAEASRAFSRLGLTAVDSHGNFKNLDSMFMEVIGRFGSLGSSAEKTSVAMDIFGRSGADLIPFFNMGAKAIQELGTEAEQLGLVMGPRVTATFKAVGDQTDAIKSGFQGLAITMATLLLPQTLYVVTMVKTIIISFIQWIKNNSELATSILKIAMGVGIALGVLGTFLIVIGVLSSAIGAVVSIASTLITVFGYIITIVTAVGTAIASLFVTFGTLTTVFGAITMPIGLVVAALGVMVVMLYRVRDDAKIVMEFFWDKIKSVSSWIIDIVNKMVTSVLGFISKIPKVGPAITSMFEGLKSDIAIIGGFLVEKFDVGFDMVKGGAGDLVQSLSDKFDEFKDIFSSLDEDTRAKVEAILASINDGINKVPQTTVQATSEFSRIISEAAMQAYDLSARMGEIVVATADQASSAFGTGIGKMLVDGKSLSSSLKYFWKDIASSFISAVASMMVKWLAFKAITGVFGISIPGFQRGGVVYRPTLATVGEAGPERITPIAGGATAQTAQTAGSLNISFGAVNISLQGTFDLSNPTVRRQILASVAEELKTETVEAIALARRSGDLSTKFAARAV